DALQARNEQLERLQGIVRTAEALVTARDPETAAERAKQLQAEWKTVKVPGARAEVDALWARFRAACDAVFTRRAETRQESSRVAIEKLEAIVLEAEALGDPDSAVDDIDDAIGRLMGAWKRVGRAPREAHDLMWERLQAAFGRARSTRSFDLPTDESPPNRPFEELLRRR
ncbi:MAG TPA: DUF349 domain-containing protein, partial [Myxococcota bacterium]|nr:DUF349 domain-containing protein [Myxococcota bacterium]